MKVTLCAITEPHVQNEAGWPITPEEFIVYCARVSNPSNQLNTETAPKLLAYCIKHGHWSIFEQVSMTVEIVTSRAIAAQILRHKSFAFQEWSQRYSAVDAFEPVEIRKQGATNRQGGEETFDPALGADGGTRASEAIEAAIKVCRTVYQDLLAAGVAKESARMILPLCTQTRLYMTGSIRSWIHYLEVRCDPHTQKEHREVAEAIRAIFNERFPGIAKALEVKP